MSEIIKYIEHQTQTSQLSEIYECAIKLFDIDLVNLIMVDRFGYVHKNNIDKIPLSMSLQENRIGQQKFRNSLIERYKKCIITDDDPIACEACHIIPYSECKNYDIDNGLLLTATMHKLFDSYCMTIDAKTNRVVLSTSVSGAIWNNYKQYDNKLIIGLTKRTIEYLVFHNKKFEFSTD